MIISFLIYGFLGLILWYLGEIAKMRERIYLSKNKIPTFWTWEITSSLLVFSIISGLRWQVGVDHLSYLNNYEKIRNGFPPDYPDFEPAFAFITTTLANLNIPYTIYFASLAFAQLFFVYSGLKKYRYLYPYLGLVVVLGTQYLDWMNGIRQAMAAAVFVYAAQYIAKRQLANYIFFIILASIFHKSALITIPFYLVAQRDIFKRKFTTILLCTASIFVGLYTNMLNSTQLINSILVALDYNNYSDNLENILNETVSSVAFGPRRISTAILYFSLIHYSNELKKYYSGSYFIVGYNLTIFGFIYYNLFSETGHILLRPMYYFAIFLPVSLSFLLNYLRKTRNFRSGEFICILLLSCSHTFLAVLAQTDDPKSDYASYKLSWTNDPNF